MGEFLETMLEKINNVFPVERTSICENLERIRYPFKLLELTLQNWQAEKIRKIYLMEMKMRIPGMHQQGISIYPAKGFAMPIFVADLTLMKKKSICYVNAVPMLEDEYYHAAYMTPFEKMYKKHKELPQNEMPAWMQPHKTQFTFFAKPSSKFYNDYCQCALDYLSCYLDQFAGCELSQDKRYIQNLQDSHQAYRKFMLTDDKTRLLLGRLIGQKRSCDIFSKVLS